MRTDTKPQVVIIVGSGPDAARSATWCYSGYQKVAINNAWRLRDDWDFHIFPEDFPLENIPSNVNPHTQTVTYKDFVPEQNKYGGFVYAGGTMAFTAAYWALGALNPDVLGFIGCDMVYSTDGSNTHFYGNGAPDPLRDDATLQSLEAKSQRLKVLAAQQACLCVNLSSLPASRLLFPRKSVEQVMAMTGADLLEGLAVVERSLADAQVHAALEAEKRLNYFVQSGRYWEKEHLLSRAELASIDQLWLSSQRV